MNDRLVRAAGHNLRAFAAAVRGEADDPFTDAQKIGSVAILEAVAQPVASGAPVSLAP